MRISISTRALALLAVVQIAYLEPPIQAAVTPISSVVAGTDGMPPYNLQSVTVGSYTLNVLDLRTGTTTALPGGNDGGDFFDTWLPPFDPPAPNDNFDLNSILARNTNPNPIIVKNFGGVPLWMDSNGDNPDFFIFEAASGAFGDTGQTVQAILPGGSLGQPINLTDSGTWGDTGLTRVGNPNNGQDIVGVSFAITDLLDASGAPLSNSSMIEGLHIISMGLDPSSIAAAMVGLERLSLSVNTTTGEMSIRNNNATFPITENFLFYKIDSPAGGLRPDTWNSLADQGIDADPGGGGDYNGDGFVDAADYVVWRKSDGSQQGYDDWRMGFGGAGGGGGEPGSGWDESGGSDASQLIELRLTGHSSLGPGESFTLGNAYNTAISDMNIVFNYADQNGVMITGEVEYVTSASGTIAGGVPEPAAMWLVCGAIAPLLMLRRCRPAMLLIAMTATFLVASSAQAVEIHRYTFNDGTANDSVGTANGMLVNPEGISRFAAGQLNLTSNNGMFNTNINSGQDYASPSARGAYVDLPNFIVSDSFGGAPDGVAGNQTGAASFESWFTVDTHRTSARVWHFGNQNGGAEDSPTANGGGDGAADIGLEPQAGVGALGFAALRVQTRFDPPNGTDQPTAEDAVQLDWQNGPAPVGTEQHVVVTFDHDDLSDGPNGTAKVYINGNLEMTGPIEGDPSAGGLFLDTFEPFGDVNNWLGRSQFAGNPLLDAAINELRIYDHPLTANEITTNFNNGPTVAGTPRAATLFVDRATGDVTLVNEEATPLEVTGYSISSAAGGLNPAGWSSIDDATTSWTESSATGMQLAESESGGGSAGSLTPGTPLSLGSAFLQSPFEDLLFTYTLSDGTNGSGFVKYTGDVLARSDLDGDGDIDRADWGVFVANNYTDFTGVSSAVAYRRGDLDFDLDNDFDDFLIFRNDFTAANGAAAFAHLSQSVPEPSSLVLILCAALALAHRRRQLAR